MSVADKGRNPDSSLPPTAGKKRRSISPEKKYQIFLEAQRRDAPVGELLRREGLYSTDLARIQR
jgi:transposase-like protein